MGRATNAGASPSAGRFATTRRGGLTNEEIHMIEAKRAAPRPVPWQAIARQFGRPEAEVRAVFEATPRTGIAPVVIAEPEKKRPGAQPRQLTDRDHLILSMVEAGQVTQVAASRLMECTPAAVRRYLERRADAREAA